MPRSMNALDLLRRDHRYVQALLKKIGKADAENEQRELCRQVLDELRTHTEIEEQVFYPYLREATAREDLFQEASIEHDTAKQLMAQLPQEQPGTPRFKAMVKVLAEYVEHHVQEEEKEIFPQVEKTGVDLQALGLALQECRDGKDPMAETGDALPDDNPRQAEKADGHGKGAQSDDSDEDEDSNMPHGLDAKAHKRDDERYLREHEGEGLSRSTERAKWIHSADDKPERDGQTLATRNVDVIRAWAQARGAHPATTPGGDTERPRVLRLDFPGYDKNLEPVSWDAFARVFQERDLVFLFQDKKADGDQSNFFRFDSPERNDA